MDARLRDFVRQRARGRCEYGTLQQDQEPFPFHMIIGLTPPGRATVRLLRMSQDGRLKLRTGR